MKLVTKPCGAAVVRTTNWQGWRLTIMAPADYDDGRQQPAQSVEIFSEDYIRQLRDALNEALEE